MDERDNRMTIGEVERHSGVPITTLRYYERWGLIDAPARVSGQRRYDASVMMRLMLIRFCRVAGLSLDEIALVIADRSENRTITKELAARRIEAIDDQIAELTLARQMMDAARTCTCDTVDECTCGAIAPVVAALRAHAAGSGT